MSDRARSYIKKQFLNGKLRVVGITMWNNHNYEKPHIRYAYNGETYGFPRQFVFKNGKSETISKIREEYNEHFFVLMWMQILVPDVILLDLCETQYKYKTSYELGEIVDIMNISLLKTYFKLSQQVDKL